MLYVADKHAEYRECEVDCKVGIRGYLCYFQDAYTHLFLSFGKGNDTVPVDYHRGWILTKYRMRLFERCKVTDPIRVEAWIEPQKSPVRLFVSGRISRGGQTIALGELETCIADVDSKKPARLSDIEYDRGVEEHRELEMPPIRKVVIPESADLTHRYRYTVRYCDLDNNIHMTNLRYADLAISAFDTAFYEGHRLREVELDYVAQCLEGDSIDVLAAPAGDEGWVLIRRGDGQTAVRARLGF